MYEDNNWLEKENPDWVILYYPLHVPRKEKELYLAEFRHPQNIQEAFDGQIYSESKCKFTNRFCGPGAYLGLRSHYVISLCNAI